MFNIFEKFTIDTILFTMYALAVVSANFEIKNDFSLISLILLFFILFMNAQMIGYRKRIEEE